MEEWTGKCHCSFLSLLVLGLKHFEGTEFPKPLISKYLLTCKTAHQLTVRIKNRSMNRAPDNIFKVSFPCALHQGLLMSNRSVLLVRLDEERDLLTCGRFLLPVHSVHCPLAFTGTLNYFPRSIMFCYGYYFSLNKIVKS